MRPTSRQEESASTVPLGEGVGCDAFACEDGACTHQGSAAEGERASEGTPSGGIPRTDIAALRLKHVARKYGGDDLMELSDRPPVLLWLYGSALIEATVCRSGAVQLRAHLVFDPTQPAAVSDAIRREERHLSLGRLIVDSEGDLALVHAVALERQALKLDEEVAEICRQANRLDDLLRQRVGGTRSLDRLQSECAALFLSSFPISDSSPKA